MDRANTQPNPTSQSPDSQRLKTQYLSLYNLVSGLLWLAVLGRVLFLVPLVGFEHVYEGVGEFAKWTQTLMLLEVVHSALGLIRSPLPTALMQVSSRILLVYPVVTWHPEIATSSFYSIFYSTMLFAWSVTEVVRYSYFLLNLKFGVPGFLTWARYNLFFVLYPVGITSEVILIWKAGELEGGYGAWARWVVLAIYVPGAHILYTHMMAQRRKVIRGKAPERRKAAN
ncbi:hypothetical protein MMC25_002616 [Agyrium rufum]|nr:hypothetical protein [Agyrium rufum]